MRPSSGTNTIRPSTTVSFITPPYESYKYTGAPEELNTECMNRNGQSIPGIAEHFQGRTGFIFWEFGIGRDNRRFRWDENREHPRADESPKPFHGMVYPDGHPWSVDDVRALLGPEAFASAPLFAVEYYRDAHFGGLARESVTPMIDFGLGRTGVRQADSDAKQAGKFAVIPSPGGRQKIARRFITWFCHAA